MRPAAVLPWRPAAGLALVFLFLALGHVVRDRWLLDTDGQWREALETLPGVGRKTANVVLNEAFGQETCAVDTHIFRVANRTGLGPGKTPLAVENAVMANTPRRFRRHAHHWLILHGRYVCVARKPKCDACPVARSCNWPEKPITAGSVAIHPAPPIGSSQ